METVMVKSQSRGSTSKPLTQNSTAERETPQRNEQSSGEALATEIWWRTFKLSHREAEAGSPADASNCGEEDPGSGLEFLVTQEDRRKKAR
jgi:hypothetical protein